MLGYASVMETGVWTDVSLLRSNWVIPNCQDVFCLKSRLYNLEDLNVIFLNSKNISVLQQIKSRSNKVLVPCIHELFSSCWVGAPMFHLENTAELIYSVYKNKIEGIKITIFNLVKVLSIQTELKCWNIGADLTIRSTQNSNYSLINRVAATVA